MRSCICFEFLNSLNGRTAGPVGPIRGERIVGVHDEIDARAQGDLLALEPQWVSFAVQPLVARGDDWDDLGKAPYAFDDSCPCVSMGAHDLPFSIGELPGLQEDLGWDNHLPDVVEEAREVYRMHVGLIDVENSGDAPAQLGDLCGMAGGVRVLGIDRARQRVIARAADKGDGVVQVAAEHDVGCARVVIRSRIADDVRTLPAGSVGAVQSDIAAIGEVHRSAGARGDDGS